MDSFSKKDRQLVAAICSLKDNKDFKTLMIAIQGARDSQRASNDLLSGNDLYRGQGRSLELTDFLERIETAEDTIRLIDGLAPRSTAIRDEKW